jgi:hypothetical protein
MTRLAQDAGPPRPRRPWQRARSRFGCALRGRTGPDDAAMTRPPANPTEPLEATRVAAGRSDRHQHLWAMTREERTAAFFRGELTLGDCMAWSRRYPDEPPTGPCGEYLYILATTPEWLGET